MAQNVDLLYARFSQTQNLLMEELGKLQLTIPTQCNQSQSSFLSLVNRPFLLIRRNDMIAYISICNCIGTDIWVYFIISTLIENVITDTAANLTLDGTLQRRFFYHSTNPNEFIYDMIGLERHGLQNEQHTLKIEVGDGFRSGSVVIFDYAIYTYVLLFCYDNYVIQIR
jgi:hypothetical protein